MNKNRFHIWEIWTKVTKNSLEKSNFMKMCFEKWTAWCSHFVETATTSSTQIINEFVQLPIQNLRIFFTSSKVMKAPTRFITHFDCHTHDRTINYMWTHNHTLKHIEIRMNANGRFIKARRYWRQNKNGDWTVSLRQFSHTSHCNVSNCMMMSYHQSKVVERTKKNPSWDSIFLLKKQHFCRTAPTLLPLQYHPLDRSMRMWIISMGFFVFPLSKINNNKQTNGKKFQLNYKTLFKSRIERKKNCHIHRCA